MNFKYPLATATWDQNEIDAMHSVIQSGSFTMGNKLLALSMNSHNLLGANMQ